jgi:hypothetical protein
VKLLRVAFVFACMVTGTLNNLWAKDGSITGFGWTVTADEAGARLTISHQSLGAILQEVHLNLRNEEKLLRATTWASVRIVDNQVTIKTADPQSLWVFEIRANELLVSSTSSDAVLTGVAPASPQRRIARLLDPQGATVDWVGTGEVEVTYGGTHTHNVSHLPRRNPDCAYYALGQVSAAGLHALFDRPSDVAIEFPEDTALSRRADNLDVLDVIIPVATSASVRLLPDYFTKVLGLPVYVPFDDSHFPIAPMVWSSWTSYYERVNEEDIVRNTDWIAAHLKPYGFQYVQLDDGYDRGPQNEHYWIRNWDQEKFPHGPGWLANYIHEKGLRPGVWLVPNSSASAFAEHPEWYLYYKNGKPVFDYNSPALDSTNPAVLDFLRNEMTTLDHWGFEYYKFDGEHAMPKYVPGVDRDRLFDKSIDPVAAYRNRLALIRNTIGPERYIEGDVAGTPLDGVGYINSYFNGHDLYDNWQGMYSLFSSINANGFLNHIVMYTMPGEGTAIEPRVSVAEGIKSRNVRVIETEKEREVPLTGFGTTLPEARTVISTVALTGVAYSLGSVMPDLPDERLDLLRKTLPTMPIFPIDLFSRGTDMEWDRFKHITPDDYIHHYPEILDLKVNAAAGAYDVVAMTNWRSWDETRELSFPAKLGLDPNSSYVAFDFWNQELYGVFKGAMKVSVAPHDTRVFQIRPVTNHPQIVGTSRHITGAYSIRDLHWDAATKKLAGSSLAVPGDSYTFFVYVPKGQSVRELKASVHGGTTVPVRQFQRARTLKVTFMGRTEPVEWEIIFNKQ